MPVYQPGWSWTYNQTYTIDSPATATQKLEYFNIDETVTYTVQGIVQHTNYTCPSSYQGGLCTASTPGATNAGTYTAYQITYTGVVTGGSGQAQGQNLSINNGASNMSGTEYIAVGNLATVENDQVQNVSGTAVVVTVTLSLTNDDVYTPAQVVQDFRLHSGDSWLENTDVYDNGLVTYNAGSFGSGTSDIDSYGPIDATATDASTTASEPIGSNLPVDQVAYNDTVNTTSETRDWSNTYHNVAYDNFLTGVAQGGSCTTAATASCLQTTMALASASIPNPSLTISESVGGLTNGLACGGETVPVSGTLSTGASGATVTATLDKSTASPDTGVTQTTTSASGGAYSFNFTAPTTADGLQKPSVNGSWPIEVSSGNASNDVTLEVGTQDCSSTSYTGSTAGAIGSSQTVSASVTDIGTGQPVSGASVTFSLNGTNVVAGTGSNGVASTSMVVAGPVGVDTITASTAATGTETASSASSTFDVMTDPTVTTLVASEPDAAQGDHVSFTASVAPSGPTSGALNGTVTFSVDHSQLGSAVTLVNGSATSTTDSTMSVGTHDIQAVYNGSTTYQSSAGEIPTYRVHPPLLGTKTTLSASPNPAVFGQQVLLTATVAPSSGSGSPSGSVAFYNGTTELGTAALGGGTPDTATMTVSSLAVGGHSLTADYLGDGDVTYASSNSAPQSETVAQAQTTTSVSSSINPTVSGQGTTFTVTVAPVAPGAGIPAGTAQVTVNGSDLGSALTLSGGTATVSDPSLMTGSYTVTASYSGDSGFAQSSGSTTQTVNQDATTTSLTSTPDPSIQDQAVTFTATVTPATPGGGTPTGEVTFTTNGGATTLGTAAVASGSNGTQASIELANLPIGDTNVAASYAGDANFTGSSSQPVDQSVQPAPPVVETTTSVTSTQEPSIYGQSVSFTATVAAASGSNVPTGTVQFSVDGTDLGAPVPLDANGMATSPPVSSLQAGGHAVIAAYSGDSTPGHFGFDASGAILTQQVQQATTQVVGTPATNPLPYGQTQSVSVQVSAIAPGAGTPTGQVQFRIDGVALGSPVTVDANGDATTPPVNGLLPGTHTVSFVDSGDANFFGSNGSVTFTVSKIATQTALVVSPNPATFGQQVTMTATVSHTAGPGVPSGTVAFYDGTTKLASAALSQATGGSSSATFITTNLAAVTHSLTAVYSGDQYYATSTSSATSLVVGKAPTAVAADAATLTVTIVPNSVKTKLGPLSATLTSNGVPVAGQLLLFHANAGIRPTVCVGITNLKGVATCKTSILGAVEVGLAGGIQVVYLGNASYLPSSGTAKLVKVVIPL